MNESLSADTLTIDQIKSMAQGSVTGKEVIPLEYIPVILGALALGVILVMRKKPKRKNPRYNPDYLSIKKGNDRHIYLSNGDEIFHSDAGYLGKGGMFFSFNKKSKYVEKIPGAKTMSEAKNKYEDRTGNVIL